MIDASEFDVPHETVREAKREVARDLVEEVKGPDYCPNCGEEL